MLMALRNSYKARLHPPPTIVAKAGLTDPWQSWYTEIESRALLGLKPSLHERQIIGTAR